MRATSIDVRPYFSQFESLEQGLAPNGTARAASLIAKGLV
jgi:hypothetical protein